MNWTLQGDVLVITLASHPNTKGEYENCFDPSQVKRLHELLDKALQDKCQGIILTGGGNGKFFSNGHSLDFLGSASFSDAMRFINEFYELLARLLTFPLPVVSAINGHAFAGGCLLAMATDYRIMRKQKGFICMNEIDMIQPNVETNIKPGIYKKADQKMMAVMRCKLPALLVRDMFLQGKRLDGKEALSLGVVDHIVEGEVDIVGEALAFSKKLVSKAHAKNRMTIGILKYEMVREYVNVLCEGNGEELFQKHALAKL